MNTSKKLLLSFLAAASLSACTKETPEGNEDSDNLTIIAVTDGNLIPAWKAGDEIKVTCDGKSYDFTTSETGRSAKFTDDGSLTAEIIGDKAITAYFNCSSTRGAFRISGEQTYSNGSSSAKIPMYAYTMNAPQNNNLALTFKPVASILQVTLPAHPINVEKIEVKPAENATVSYGAISGTYTVTADDGTVAVNNDGESVELSFPTPIDITQGGTVNIPIGMFSISGGLDIVLHYETSKEMRYTIEDDTFATYNDADGVNTGVVVPVTFEMDVNSFPRAYYVTASATNGKGQSWNDPCTLDYALSNAMAGSVIHIAAGTYTPTKALQYVSEEPITSTEELNGFDITRNVKIIGGYPASPSEGAVADASANKTILDGNNKSWHVLVVGAAKIPGEKVEIEGITIQGGMNISDKTYPLVFGEGDNELKVAANYGAGLVLAGTEVDLKNVTISGNNGHCGAGVFAAGSKIGMTNCTVTENKSTGNGAGTWFSAGTELVMEGCSITKNDAGTAVVGGLYLHAPEGKSLSAIVKNTMISENKAANQGGAYVRDDSGAHLLNAVFEGCTISGNSGGMASAMHSLNANVSFKSCTFSANKGTSNGVVNFYDNCNVTFEKCTFKDNETTGGGGAIYVYTNVDGAAPKLTIANSIFSNNTAGAKGTVWLRGDKGAVTFNCVNNTFYGNKTGNVGSAINLYKNITANIISNTISGNVATYTTDNERAGAICLEAAPITVNSYNNVIAGNMRSSDNTTEDVKIKAGTITNKYSFISADFYGADGAVTAVTPTFDYTTMLGAFGNGVLKLTGSASTNPAIGNGMPVAELKALANDYISADVLGKDQNGTSRSGAMAGACVTQ